MHDTAATPATATATAADVAPPPHRGRPKRRVESKLIQLQPATAEATAATAAADSTAASVASSYAALIRLTPSLLQALLAGQAANIQFDEKDKASFVLANTIHPLRCSKEDPALISVYESLVYEHEDENENGETIGSSTDAAHKPTRLPLFAPFHAIARPLPHLQVMHKFHAPREIGITDSEGAEMLPTTTSPKAKKQRKRKGAAESEAATPADVAAAIAQQGDAPTKKQRASTKKKGAASVLAAAPSRRTAAEPLRLRVLHLLAAQPGGLTLLQICAALHVDPVKLAPVLDDAARYGPPGVFTMLPAFYSELRVDSWPDYSAVDRARIVERMRVASSSGAEDAAAAVTVRPPPSFLPPPSHSHIPDEIPASMIDPASHAEFGRDSEASAGAASASSVSPVSEPKLVPRVPLTSYLDFLALRTQFLRQRADYQRLNTWIEQQTQLQQQRAAAAPNADAETQRQGDEMEQKQAETLSICRRKCAVLRRLLVHSLPSLTAYANQSGLATDTLQLDDDRQVTSLLPSSEVGSELTGHAEASDATWSTDEAIQGENGHLQGPESPSDLEKHHMDAQPGGATQRVNEGCDKRGVECENSGEMRATLHSRRHFAPPVDSPLRN